MSIPHISTNIPQNQWSFYDQLIEGIPQDVSVTDYSLGLNWSCVVATCGAGVSYTCRGGHRYQPYDMRGASLREVALLAKSWCLEEATLGIAALNAWYAQPERSLIKQARIEPAERKGQSRLERQDPFALMKPRIESYNGTAKVAVVGHFPNVNSIASYAQLTVLERRCTTPLDTPDPACEYILPDTDFLFMTGVTLINKTAPRIIELASKAFTIMVGPSAVPSSTLFEAGVNNISGRIVTDPEQALFAVRTGNRFGASLRMFTLDAPETSVKGIEHVS